MVVCCALVWLPYGACDAFLAIRIHSCTCICYLYCVISVPHRVYDVVDGSDVLSVFGGLCLVALYATRCPTCISYSGRYFCCLPMDDTAQSDWYSIPLHLVYHALFPAHEVDGALTKTCACISVFVDVDHTMGVPYFNVICLGACVVIGGALQLIYNLLCSNCEEDRKGLLSDSYGL